jgi:pimeloyl-ACP methyl ester carboxylesterase
MKLRNGRVEIVLHEARAGGSGDLPLLLLHQVGGSAVDWLERTPVWDGPVFALDFAGHGDSSHVAGGGYCPEYHLAEADLALAAVGDRAAVAGAGLGAYVALLLAGARPEQVPAALLLPGRGLRGGGDAPGADALEMPGLDEWEAQMADDSSHYRKGTDAGVARSERDLRPPDYVQDFAQAARRLLFSQEIDSADAPGWWRIARSSSRGELASLDWNEATRQLAASCT